jgi:hypothetical protein
MPNLVQTGSALSLAIKCEAVEDPAGIGKVSELQQARKFDESQQVIIIRNYRVTWINWDSDFRNTDLQIEDVIVGINDDDLTSIRRYGQVIEFGASGESAYWEKVGGKAGQEVTLKVLREETPMEIPGKLSPDRSYFDAEEQSSLGPGGPRIRESDGFGVPWGKWYEMMVTGMTCVLDGGWTWRFLNSRDDLRELEEQKERIDFLLKSYPGPFSDTLLKDWTRVRGVLSGKRLDISEIDLEYREIGKKRVEAAKEQAAKAWDTLRAELASETISGAAPDIEERATVVGKVVEFPWIDSRDFFNDLGQTYVATDGYFICVSSSKMQPFSEAFRRFQGQVNPTVEWQFKYVGRVQDDPRMLTHRGQPVTGLMLEVVGALAGDGEIFVDLRAQSADGQCAYAGEGLMNQFASLTVPPPTASPTNVIEVMINAVKLGDREVWNSLFADWTAYDSGYFNACGGPAAESLGRAWERSRLSITGEILDARAAKAGHVRKILEKNSETGTPEVEEVDVLVDHFALFDAEVRSFMRPDHPRLWPLQRINGGPWKISRDHSL